MPTVQRHTERTSTSLKSGSITAAEASRIFEAHALSSAQLGTIIGGTIDAEAKIAPHALGSNMLGTIFPTEAETERMFGAKVIDRDLLSYLSQVGSVTLGTTRYINFPIAFGDVPSLTVTRLGSTDLTAVAPISGSSFVYGVHSISVGSFAAYATPTGYFLWQAQGSA